jgi:hypothetical protein
MCKRDASASPTLIEPDLVESASKKCRMGTQDSAALTLLSLREEEISAATGQSTSNVKAMTLSLKTKTPKNPRMESYNSSSITDDEDYAVRVFGVTSRQRDLSELKSEIQSKCPPKKKALRSPGYLFTPISLLFPPLSAPPILPLATSIHSRSLKPLTMHL